MASQTRSRQAPEFAVLFCTTLVLSGLGVAQVMGLVGVWSMQEGGGTVVYDSSGLDNHGSLIGDASFVSDPQLVGAVEISGPTGAIVIPDSTSLQPATGTLELWIKPSKKYGALLLDKQTDRLIRTNQATEAHVYYMRIFPKGSVKACIANDDPAVGVYTCVDSRDGLLVPGVWQILSMRWDGQNLALFANGTLEAAQAYLPIPVYGLSYAGLRNPLVLADNSEMVFHEKSANFEFLGRISDVRLYSYARSDTDILADYQAHKRAE